MVKRNALLHLGLELLSWLLRLLPLAIVHILNYLISGRCQLIRINRIVNIRYVLGPSLRASLLLVHLKLWLLLLLVRGLLLVLVELLAHYLG
jgi:hypothetical protein